MPAGTYGHTTFQALVDQTAQELGDSSKVFYQDLELQYNVHGTLILWNSLTGFNRTYEQFQTQQGVAFHDLTQVLPNNSLQQTTKVRDALSRIQYRLMDPSPTIDPIASTGVSEMFTHAGFVRAIQQRRDR